MKTQRNIFVVFLMIVGLFFSYWVVSGFLGGDSTNPSDVALFATRPSSADASLDPVWVEGLSTMSASENLTNKLSVNISGDFIADTAAGVNIGSRNTILSQLDIDAIKNPQDFAAYVSPDVLGIASSVSDDRVRVIVENTDAAVAEYWQEYTQIFNAFSVYQSDSADVMMQAATTAIEGGDGSGLNEFIDLLDNSVSQLEAIAVPSSLVAFHKDNLLFFDNTNAIFTAIQGASVDPLRAYLALEYLPDLEILWSRIGKAIEQDAINE